jgi:hypothetical protein
MFQDSFPYRLPVVVFVSIGIVSMAQPVHRTWQIHQVFSNG